MFDKFNPKLLVLIGVLFVSFSSILAKMSHAPALVIATYRLGFTILILLPYMLINNLSEIKKIDRKSIII